MMCKCLNANMNHMFRLLSEMSSSLVLVKNSYDANASVNHIKRYTKTMRTIMTVLKAIIGKSNGVQSAEKDSVCMKL